ncbi:MAG: GNAT family N-acetyltransferase/peptidase C39 family protein [Gammaproteobacteria bacterium]|nr:GNAT family N-acetyltransferase/peptidase C39 family protein [Gammaproteobacteria bacterium]
MADPGPDVKQTVALRAANLDDVQALNRLEKQCFATDRISRRQFRWMISKANAQLLVAGSSEHIFAYVLVLFHRGTSLARLYSIAIDPEHRGQGLADLLIQKAEEAAREQHCVYLRLEVNPDNAPAIRLYRRHGYYEFGRIVDYYDDHSDALRFEKRVYSLDQNVNRRVPFYAQTTDFTCGPASLIMAMLAINPNLNADKRMEFQLWREATTIFMMSGHGGCSAQGLALAAWLRGFRVKLFTNQKEAMFTEGVRSQAKKDIIELVHADFMAQIEASDIEAFYKPFRVDTLIQQWKLGGIPLVLISSYRFNWSKTPHWVVIAAADDKFVYLHDPEVDEEEHRTTADCIYMPVRIEEFERMIHFGQARVQSAVVVFARQEESSQS